MAMITINDLELNKELDREAMRELRGKGLNSVKSKMKRSQKFTDSHHEIS